jgi:hypothetical protein
MAGYSGTPLPRKLGIKPPLTLVAIDAPREYRAWLGELPAGVRIVSTAAAPLQAVHLFVTKRSLLANKIVTLRRQLEQTGFVWVSWPKKASKVATDLTEDVIRELALPLGFVDIKVCAVSDVWSGLKLVIRKSERTRAAGPVPSGGSGSSREVNRPKIAHI